MASANPAGRSWLLFLLFGAFLILTFLWDLLMPGGSWPVPPENYLAMALDLGVLIGLVGSRAQLASALPSDDKRRAAYRFRARPDRRYRRAGDPLHR